MTTTTTNKKNGSNSPVEAAQAAVTPSTPSALAGYVEYQALGGVTADGFWNIPRETSEAAKIVGETVHGILIAKVTSSKGKTLENPFYIFELLADHHRITLRDGETKATRTGTLKAGQRVGISAGWKKLSNLDRFMGHGIHLTFLGKANYPGGRIGNDIKVMKTPSALREIESITEQKATEGDKGGEGESTPWD